MYRTFTSMRLWPISFIKMKMLLRKIALVILPLLLAATLACQQKVKSEQVVYQNDFESQDSTALSGARFFKYNNSTVIGYYNRGGFDVHLDNLSKHDVIFISFDLYIHDSWEGNNHPAGGPDLWTVKVGKLAFTTTFSNSICESTYCLKQSYPGTFTTLNAPKTGATQTGLPTRCYTGSVPSSTTLYHIEKYFRHNSSDANISFFDQLTQAFKGDHACDESWSLDNLTIKTLRVN